jgi:hypothetical protein
MSRVEVVTSSFCCQNPICVKLCRSNPRFAMSSAENGSSPSVSPQTKQQNPTVCPKQVANQHLSPKIPQTKSVDIYKNPPKTHQKPTIFRSHQRQEPAALAELLGAVGRTRTALAEKVPVLVKLMATADDQVGFWRKS